MEISNDLINEILSYCSSETLATCRLLSKNTDSATHLSEFISLQSKRSNTIYGYFVQEFRIWKYQSSFVSPFPATRKPSLDFLPDDDVKIEASTEQGILLCSNEWRAPPCYYVCKPCTEEWVKIPNPNSKLRTRSFGMVVMKLKPLRFKIVRFSNADSRFIKGRVDRRFSMWCEVFDSNTWRWRKLEKVVFLYRYYETLCRQPAVAACGSLHWLTTSQSILALDVVNERYHIYSSPESDDGIFCGRSKSKLVKYEGKLAFIYAREEDNYGSVQLWVLENYKQGLWKKRKDIWLGDVRTKHGEPHSEIIGFYGSDVAVMKGTYKLLYYNLESKSIKSATMDFGSAREGDTFHFQSDYEKCYLGRHPIVGGVGRAMSRTLSCLENSIPITQVGLLVFCLGITYYPLFLNF